MSLNPMKQSFKSAAKTYIKNKSQQVGTVFIGKDLVTVN
jgi:hypothetical protein